MSDFHLVSDKKRPSGYHAEELKHADDAAKVAEAEKDVEARSRPVSAEEQIAFRAQWLKGKPAEQALCGHGQVAANCGMCHDLEALRSKGRAV